jgi:hypothetical protein
LIDCFGDDRVDLISNFKPIIPRLIEEIKTRTDMIRKRSAITMAKLAKDKDLLTYIRSLNRMRLLISLQN